jgi:hypothetical protein
MNKRFTYRQLHDTLKGLGYLEQSVDVDGTRQHIFRHPAYPRATIFLPATSPDESVLPMHLGAVRAVLTTHGIVEDDPDQSFIQRLAANEKSRAGQG